MSTVDSIARTYEFGEKLKTVAPEDTASNAAKTMCNCHVGCLLVVDRDDSLVGIISERDILTKITATDKDARTVSIEQVMTTSVVSCAPNTSTDEAQDIMARHHIRHLPIVKGTKAVGMVSISDVIACQLKVAQERDEQQQGILQQLEDTHPGITQMSTDKSGRIVI